MDDLKFHLLAAKERLKNQYNIIPAQTMEELFELLEMTRPDMILLDINMPDIDGFEMLRAIKDDFRFSHIPVIFLSAQYDKKSVSKGMRLGAVDFVSKPFSDAKLIERIEMQLNPALREDLLPVILAIDDNMSLLKSIYNLLCDDYRVCTLPRPEKLKDLLRSLTPDLFILDCNMPIISGVELVPLIRSTPGHEETPILFLTSDGTADNVYLTMNTGACDFLVKPVDEVILREKLSTHLQDYLILRRIRSIAEAAL